MPSEAFRQVVALLTAGETGGPEIPTVEESRAALDALGALFAVPDDVEVAAVEIAGVPCERFRPAAVADAPGRLLYLHGGAYVGGGLDSHRSLVARLARACGCETLSVDYRLAPEHPYPAGLDDALAVYRHVVEEEAPPDQLVVAGDSAGGGLTAALLLGLRDRGAELPAGAVLLSPWLDLTHTSASITELAAHDPLLRVDSLTSSAQAYAGDDLRNPLVSPVFGDLAGLPPLLILVGTAEILLDDSRTFAERARSAGVDVELDIGEGLIHVWPFIDGIPESAAALERIGTWSREVRTGT